MRITADAIPGITRVFSKIDKKKVFQLKPDSDRVLSPDSEYMTQSGQIGR